MVRHGEILASRPGSHQTGMILVSARGRGQQNGTPFAPGGISSSEAPKGGFAMRALYLLILVAVVGALAVFAVENQQDITLKFLQWQLTTNTALVIGTVYVLGMLSGWTVVGLLRRSW